MWCTTNRSDALLYRSASSIGTMNEEIKPDKLNTDRYIFTADLMTACVSIFDLQNDGQTPCIRMDTFLDKIHTFNVAFDCNVYNREHKGLFDSGLAKNMDWGGWTSHDNPMLHAYLTYFYIACVFMTHRKTVRPNSYMTNKDVLLYHSLNYYINHILFMAEDCRRAANDEALQQQVIGDEWVGEIKKVDNLFKNSIIEILDDRYTDYETYASKIKEVERRMQKNIIGISKRNLAADIGVTVGGTILASQAMDAGPVIINSVLSGLGTGFTGFGTKSWIDASIAAAGGCVLTTGPLASACTVIIGIVAVAVGWGIQALSAATSHTNRIIASMNFEAPLTNYQNENNMQNVLLLKFPNDVVQHTRWWKSFSTHANSFKNILLIDYTKGTGIGGWDISPFRHDKL